MKISVGNLRFLVVMSLGVCNDLLEVQEFLNHGVRAARLFRRMDNAAKPWSFAQLKESIAAREELLQELLETYAEVPEDLVRQYLDLTQEDFKKGPALKGGDIPRRWVREYEGLAKQNGILDLEIPDFYFKQRVTNVGTKVPKAFSSIYTRLRLWRKAYEEWENKAKCDSRKKMAEVLCYQIQRETSSFDEEALHGFAGLALTSEPWERENIKLAMLNYLSRPLQNKVKLEEKGSERPRTFRGGSPTTSESSTAYPSSSGQESEEEGSDLSIEEDIWSEEKAFYGGDGDEEKEEWR
jgi:hypothetical protein